MQEASQHELTERGYQLDHEGQDAQNRANDAAVELERAAAKERANTRAGERTGNTHCRRGRGA